MKKLLALATLLLSSTPINSAHALFGDPPTKLFSEEQTWRVGWDQSIGKDGLGICYTHQAFLNKVHIWIGSKLGIEQMSDSWFLAIYIPDLKFKVDDKVNLFLKCKIFLLNQVIKVMNLRCLLQNMQIIRNSFLNLSIRILQIIWPLIGKCNGCKLI